MPLNDRRNELNRGTSSRGEWFIGYAFTDNDEQVSTVLNAFSEEEALKQFNADFWRIAYGDRSGKGPNGVDPHNLYEIVEIRPATIRDRRPSRD